MTHYAIKILVTTLLIVIISEISKRSTLIGATLASVPLVSVLAWSAATICVIALAALLHAL
jgi:hypothetical protein